MLKFWAIAFCGIAVFAHVAICNDHDSFENVSMELLKDLPKYFKEAIEEVEEEDTKIASKGVEAFRSNWISQCSKDFLYIYTAMIRDGNFTDWPFQGIVIYRIGWNLRIVFINKSIEFLIQKKM